jgi:hypothetical protein
MSMITIIMSMNMTIITIMTMTMTTDMVSLDLGTLLWHGPTDMVTV